MDFVGIYVYVDVIISLAAANFQHYCLCILYSLYLLITVDHTQDQQSCTTRDTSDTGLLSLTLDQTSPTNSEVDPQWDDALFLL